MSAVAKPLMSLDDALAIMLSHVQSLTSVETVATWDADGRMLAEDVVSELAVPALDNSSMDGYALRCSAVPHVGSTLRVTQRIPAGSHGQPLHPGEAARIFTGAPIPPGADAVVMQEHVSVDPVQPEIITINQTVSKGQWIRRAGEDVSMGAVILPRGCPYNRRSWVWPPALAGPSWRWCANPVSPCSPRVTNSSCLAVWHRPT